MRNQGVCPIPHRKTYFFPANLAAASSTAIIPMRNNKILFIDSQTATGKSGNTLNKTVFNTATTDNQNFRDNASFPKTDNCGAAIVSPSGDLLCHP